MWPLAFVAVSALPVHNNATHSLARKRQDSQSSIPSHIYRTRAQSAVNLGFWLVGERYGNPEHFDSCGADRKHNDEFALAKSCSKEQQENFWNTFINEGDFALMAQMGINTVRLPVGYWSVGKANCQCADTPFWPYIDKYETQWSYVEKAISWAAQFQIGVLIDFHGAEGSQNGWEHAGIDLKKATFLDRKSFKEHTTLVLEWIASQIKDKPNVVGLELLNEPNPDDHRRINPWYESTLNRLRPILGDDFPFYISGSISDQVRIDWIRQQPGFIVMDYHMYPVFDSRYKRKSAQEQIDMIHKEYAPLYDKVRDINLIVGEWACTNANDKQDWDGQKAFCDAEMSMLSKPEIAGIHYWSWKTQGNWFNTWSFLSSSGGPDGLARIGDPDNRPLLIPANGQGNFWPSSRDMSAKGQRRKRSEVIAEQTPDAVQVWDKGCQAAEEFADYGARLGFTKEYIKRNSLVSKNHTEREFYRHFSRGLQDCQV
ncbi:Glucan 1,3-beta-glucosidase 3 [Naganishia albida]|nr:Glucan 1,3-beta-glucosidase 3 [Naganishia albida]